MVQICLILIEKHCGALFTQSLPHSPSPTRRLAIPNPQPAEKAIKKIKEAQKREEGGLAPCRRRRGMATYNGTPRSSPPLLRQHPPRRRRPHCHGRPRGALRLRLSLKFARASTPHSSDYDGGAKGGVAHGGSLTAPFTEAGLVVVRDGLERKQWLSILS